MHHADSFKNHYTLSGEQSYILAETYQEMLAFVFVFLCTLVHLSCALPLSSFYSYGSSAEDTKLPPTDEDKFYVALSSHFSFFDGEYTELYVSWVNKIYSADFSDCGNVVLPIGWQ